MERDDARYSTLEQLHERRKQVVRLHRKEYGVMQIVELSGLSYPTIRAAIDRYEERGGLTAIKPATRGKRAGQGRTLTEGQEQAILKIIYDKRPEQLKIEFALWNWAAVMQLIERTCGIKLSVRGVGNYLSRWGFVLLRRNRSRKPTSSGRKLCKPGSMSNTRKLRSEPRRKAARFTGAMRPPWSIPTWGRSYSPAGKTTVTYTVGGTMIATVTNQGKTRWMIIDEAFNADKLIEFLAALIKDAGKKVFLILDNLRATTANRSRRAAERRDKIELFYLPSYSPELNPEERLNADLKQATGTKVPVRTKA